jgi:hypothetical protein
VIKTLSELASSAGRMAPEAAGVLFASRPKSNVPNPTTPPSRDRYRNDAEIINEALPGIGALDIHDRMRRKLEYYAVLVDGRGTGAAEP